MNEIEIHYKLWPRQKQAFTSEATEELFGGASEGGKSHFIRIAAICWCLDIPGLQCVLIRKKYQDILLNHVEGPTGFKVLLAPLVQRGMVKITKDEVRFKNGSLLTFVHCQDERQFDTAQGIEKHLLIIDEATQISERLIRFFRTWCRMPLSFKESLPERWRNVFPRIIYTANPIGPSVPFFRRAFIKARAPFAIDSVEGFKRQYIPSRVEDNPAVDAALHQARLDGLNDPALARALHSGDWDAPVGEFFPMYDETRHVTPDFTPPEHWFKYLSFDWGSAEPFCVIWWCVSDGQEFKGPLGETRWFRRGAIIAYREWYGCSETDPAKGLEMDNRMIAKGIVARTREKTSGIVLTDSKPFQSHGERRANKKYTIADTFSDEGCPLIRANTARITGWSEVRDRLIGIDDDPMILFAQSCRYTRDYLPAIGRSKTDPEDAEEDGEATHAPDCVRYACAARPLTKDKIVPLDPTVKPVIITPASIVKQLEQERGRGYRRRA